MLASLYTDSYAAAETGVNIRTVAYWREKYESPSLHASGWGGARNWTMNVEQHTLVEGMLWQMVEDLPTETPHGYCALLRELDIPVTTAWVVRVLSRWNYSRKKVQHTQAKKFTVVNVCRYIDHVLAAPNLDPTKLKYLDESRFETRRVRRQYGYSPRGDRINISAGATLQVRRRVHALICAILVFILQATISAIA
jgi:transposase